MRDAFGPNPGGQGWQELLPGAGAIVPGGQFVQEPLPGVENEPGGHAVQLPLPGSENVPPGQFVHDPLPANENVPGGHVEQSALPGSEKVPAAQFRHVVWPKAGWKRPAGQAVHGALPLGLADPGEQSCADAGVTANAQERTNSRARQRVDERIGRCSSEVDR